MRVGFCSSPRFCAHRTGPNHPERPDRLRAIFSAVREAGLVRSPNPLPDIGIDFGLKTLKAPAAVELEPRFATLNDMLRVHARRHISRVRLRCVSGGELDSGDTPVCRQSYDTALLAAGACLECVDAVMDGRVDRAFAAVRPPGHHAEANASMGFCVFSNLAIAAKYAQKVHGVEKIAIVDFDVHHGNGTQAAFQTDPSVLFASIHEDPHILFPGTGFAWEIGAGEGRGSTINLPQSPGTGDEEFLGSFREKVMPRVEAFAPNLVMVSAGFDGHRDDPLADLRLTEDAYVQVTRMLVEIANRHARGRIVSVLEGGYNLLALGRCVALHVLELSR